MSEDIEKNNTAEAQQLEEDEKRKNSGLVISEGGLIARLNLRKYNSNPQENHAEIKLIVDEVKKYKLEQKKDLQGNIEHFKNDQSILIEKKNKDGISFYPKKHSNCSFTVAIPQRNLNGSLSSEHFDVLEINKKGEIINFRSANLKISENKQITKGHDTNTTSQLDMSWLQQKIQKIKSGAAVESNKDHNLVSQSQAVAPVDVDYLTMDKTSSASRRGADLKKTDLEGSVDLMHKVRSAMSTEDLTEARDAAAVLEQSRKSGSSKHRSKAPPPPNRNSAIKIDHNRQPESSRKRSKAPPPPDRRSLRTFKTEGRS